MHRSRVHFGDADVASVSIPSTWNSKTKKVPCNLITIFFIIDSIILSQVRGGHRPSS